MKQIKLFDTDGVTLLGYLENAYVKKYTKRLNDIWDAGFSLPADDPKTALCTPYRVIELFDGDERVDKFRILPITHVSGENGEVITYECEHVLATLVDDLMFQYHESDGYNTSEVIEYLLEFQETVRWTLGVVDFDRTYAYKWESENVLNAILSITKAFSDDFQWTWDTTDYPWVLNLIIPSETVRTEVVYGRNLKGVNKDVDPTDLCTRLYCLGYGSGVNQLVISEVNSGVPYLDADTQATYGIISKIYTDTTEENAETLMAKAASTLEKLKSPVITYTFSAAHIFSITKNVVDDFYIGGYCSVEDNDARLDLTARVVEISKPDIDGKPGDVNITISNKVEDVASDISSLVDKQRITEVYDQGSVMIDSQNFSANLSMYHPTTLKFYIPEDAIRINKVELTYESLGYESYVSLNTSMAPASPIIAGLDHMHVATQEIAKDSPDRPFSGIRVDNTMLPTPVGASGENVDITPYLHDIYGKIEKGAWHEITFFNDDLARVSAQVITKMFIQSRGGGDY